MKRIKDNLARLGKVPGRVWKFVNLDFNDFCLFGGAALVAFGIYLIYQPAAYISIGLVLIWFGRPRPQRSK